MRYARGLTSHRPLSELALPHMRSLLDMYGETINLGVLRDGEVLYLEMLESPHSFRMPAQVGALPSMRSRRSRQAKGCGGRRGEKRLAPRGVRRDGFHLSQLDTKVDRKIGTKHHATRLQRPDQEPDGLWRAP